MRTSWMRHLRIRPIRTSDAALLRDGFSRLSRESRRARFFLPISELSDEAVRRMTDVDGRDHAALVAISRDGGRGFGVARYVRSKDDPSCAEIAVTVVDEAQGHGLGPALLRALARAAREAGVTTFTMDVLSDNVRVRRLLWKLHAEWVGRDGEVAKYVLPVRNVDAVGRLAWPHAA